MIPQRIDPLMDLQSFCTFAGKWGISTDLANRLRLVAQDMPVTISIFSGFRTKDHQERLRAEGRPTAPPGVSTHTTYPATGADIELAVATDRAVQLTFGAVVTARGLRWGGGSPVDPDTGIPSDWKHVDLGPRSCPP